MALIVAAQAHGGLAKVHPFMFYSSADVSTLRSRINQSLYADPFNELKIDCRSRYGPSSTIKSPPDRRIWEAMRSHAALLMLDPATAAEDRYQCAAQFKRYFNAVLNASGWSDFFGADSVVSPYLLTGLMVGYDMNPGAFSASERQALVSKLASRADYMIDHTDFLEIPVDLNNSSSYYLHTFKVLRNKFIMSFSTLGMIAYGLEGEVDETRRQRWISTVEKCLATWNSKALADGVSLESYSYNELSGELLFMFLEVRTRVTGRNQFALYPAAAQYPLVSIYSWIPGGDRSFVAPIPWGDCDVAPPGDMRSNAAAVVRRLKDVSSSQAKLAQWMAYRPLGGIASNSYARDDAQHYFSVDPSVATASPAAQALPRYHYFPNSGTFVWRSGWDNMATYFALTCGPQLGGHQAPEAGTFVIFKGGAPFIAPHYYLNNHLTADHNVMRIDGQGQNGEDSSSITTKPQPPSKWGKIVSVVASDNYFNVFADMRPFYASTRVSRYAREYVGFADTYFVRDSTACTAAVAHENLLHAYRSKQPPAGDLETLDPDSDPTGNPWSGSGASYALRPRTAGPFTGYMGVQDLSAKYWSASIKADQVKKKSGTSQRGYKMVRTLNSSAASSLMAFYFPGAGQSLSKWPAADGEGVKFIENGYTMGVMVWPANGSIGGTAGLIMKGAMGGVHLTRGWVWGRDLTSLTYNATAYFSATQPMSFFTAAPVSGVWKIQLYAPKGGSFSLRSPTAAKDVWINGARLATTQWTQSGGMLKVTLAAPVTRAY